MKGGKDGKGEGEGAELRRRAEARLAGRRPARVEIDGDARRLLHELEVHQAELELQNDELRATRAEVEAGLHRYTELFDFAPIGYACLDSQGVIRELNHAAARLLGSPRGALAGRALAPLVALDQRATFEEFLARILTRPSDEPGSESCELQLAPSWDRGIDVRLTGTCLGGPSLRALVAIEDVSARKRAEQALREESGHKDEFLAALSHELRNPLAPIRNSLYVLERAPAGGERAQRAKAVIDRQVGHLTRIIDDLLDVTRIARGKARLEHDRLDLGELVRRAVEDHRPSFEAGGVRLEADLGPEPLWLDGDATRLAQVLGNLLVNAVKFTRRGDRVLVSLRRSGEAEAELAVHDTGVGIAPELLGHLFEPFRQAPQTLERTRGGLGLGLAMVKGLVELHGGSVRVESEGLGRGSSFTIRLPLAAQPLPAAAPCPTASPRSFRVVVIEDNVDAADSLVEVLHDQGHDVQVAYDGPTGLALTRESRAEVVICDIGLPGMNGYEVARNLRADEELRGVHLVALTGYAHPEDTQRAADAGFDQHIAKPATIEKLQRLFVSAIAAARRAR